MEGHISIKYDSWRSLENDIVLANLDGGGILEPYVEKEIMENS